MEFFADNWGGLSLLIFIIVEKFIKKSKSKKDDIVLDIVWEGLKRIVMRGRT